MRFGIIPAHGPQYFDTAVEQVRLCDQELDIDSVWIEEHHASGPYWPTPMLALAGLAPHTERLLLGTNILILPLHDPVHVAEQFAVLDQMTRGRMILAVALGDSEREFAMFRVHSERRGAAFEEQIRIIRALWTQASVSIEGKFFNYNEIELAVPPVQQGGPPIWIGGWGPRQVRRAAVLGDAWLPGPVATLDGVLERRKAYDQHLVQLGFDPASRERPLTRDVIVQRSKEQAWQLAEKDLLPAYYESYVDSDHPLVGKKSGSDFDDLRSLARGRFIIGNPETVIAEVLECIRATATDHFIFRTKLPGVSPDAITGIIRLLGQEVIPTLRSELKSS
jgi:alkanesulfonate monooxygenase SsuD/methylene tetrahydromethanopterin reductase-like flavin-dependent oxidoreductase (luciferase family)